MVLKDNHSVRPCSFFISSVLLLATGMVVARSVLLGVMVWLGEVEVEFLLTFLVDMMTPIFLFMVTSSKFTLISFFLYLVLVFTVFTFGRVHMHIALPSISCLVACFIILALVICCFL